MKLLGPMAALAALFIVGAAAADPNDDSDTSSYHYRLRHKARRNADQPATPVMGPASDSTQYKGLQTISPYVKQQVPSDSNAYVRGAGSSRFSTTLRGQTNIIEALTPDAPIHLHITTNPNECGQHAGFGAIFCGPAMAEGKVILVWDWNGAGDVDGYRLYRTDHSYANFSIGDQKPGKQITMFIVPPQSNGYGDNCYAATAFHGKFESARSASVCVSGTSLVQTATLSPAHRLSVGHFLHYNTGTWAVLHGRVSVERNDQAAATVGYNYDRDISIDSDHATNEVYRTALYFELSPYAHKKIRKATLRMRVSTTHFYLRNDNHSSCLARVGEGVAYWWDHPTDLIEMTEKIAPGTQEGPDVMYDVTPVVLDLATALQQNFGMVLAGNSEDINAFTADACKTQFVPDVISLTLEYTD